MTRVVNAGPLQNKNMHAVKLDRITLLSHLLLELRLKHAADVCGAD